MGLTRYLAGEVDGTAPLEALVNRPGERSVASRHDSPTPMSRLGSLTRLGSVSAMSFIVRRQ